MSVYENNKINNSVCENLKRCSTLGPSNQMSPCITSPATWPSRAPKAAKAFIAIAWTGPPFLLACSPPNPIVPAPLWAPGVVACLQPCFWLLNLGFSSVSPGIWCKQSLAILSWLPSLPLLILVSWFWHLTSGESQHWGSCKEDIRQIIRVMNVCSFHLSLYFLSGYVKYVCSFSCLFNTKTPISGGNVPFYQ